MTERLVPTAASPPQPCGEHQQLESPDLDRKMQWSRFLVTSCYLLLGCAAYWTGAVTQNSLKVIPAIAIMPFSALLSMRLLQKNAATSLRSSRISIAGLALDGLLTTWVIYWTGGANSPCLPFYLTAVMAASFRFGPKGTVISTLQAFAGHSVVVFMDPSRSHPATLLLRIVILFAAAGFGIRALNRQVERYRKEKVLRRQLQCANENLERAYQELMETQNQLLHSEKLASIGRLVAGVAHEINNPISFIYGNLVHLESYFCRLKELLTYDEGLPLPEEIRRSRESLQQTLDYRYVCEDLTRAIEGSRKGAERIRKIVEALLKCSRTRKGVFRTVDLREILENSLCVLEGKMGSNIRLLREYESAPCIRGDPDELSQLFLNVLANATDAVEQGGTIRVRTASSESTTKPEHVTVEVEDDGPGIAPENRDRVFEPFFTTKEIGRGTGLGLSIAYGIARRHGGRMEIQCPARGGTVVLVTLPLSTQFHECDDPSEIRSKGKGGEEPSLWSLPLDLSP